MKLDLSRCARMERSTIREHDWTSLENRNLTCRRVATCKPGKPGLASFSETPALLVIQFLSFRKMMVQDRRNSSSKSIRAYQKKYCWLHTWRGWGITRVEVVILKKETVGSFVCKAKCYDKLAKNESHQKKLQQLKEILQSLFRRVELKRSGWNVWWKIRLRLPQVAIAESLKQFRICWNEYSDDK